MSDTTRNNGNIHDEHDASSAPAYREPEPLDYDAPAVDDRGAHVATENDTARTDALRTDAVRTDAVRTDADADTASRTEEHRTVVPPEDAAYDTSTGAQPAAAYQTAPQHAATDASATQQYPEYTAAAPAPTPIYVQAPTPPRNRGNRGPGILIALLATVVYAVLFALVVSIISGLTSATVAEATNTFVEFIVRPVFYIPVIFFFLAFAALVAIVNRAGWWAYVLGGFLVAVVVYFSYIGGALLTVQAWNLTPSEAGRFVATQWLNPGALAAGILAREVPIWFGAWIARNGRKVTARNAEARKEYDRQIAEGPQLVRP